MAPGQKPEPTEGRAHARRPTRFRDIDLCGPVRENKTQPPNLMANEEINRTVSRKWYRCPIDPQLLRALNQRSDLKGFGQTLGHLGILVITGSAACYAAENWPWPVFFLILFAHGTCSAFLLNGFHELCHKTVFRTRWLNGFFLRIFSFLSLHTHHLFTASHTRHHQYTLHPPDDLEVVLPQQVTLRNFFASGFVNPKGFYQTWKMHIEFALGITRHEWHANLFPESDPKKRRKLIRWSRIIIAGHAAIAVISILLGYWIVPVVITLAPHYGGWLLFLTNNTQHIGLQDEVPDYRLCCRTILINPFVQFLYWHMNFHTEHHMYAAVPCYHLGRLHRTIRDDMQPCPRGLIATWREIGTIMKRQKEDPDYQYVAPLPSPEN